MAHSPRGSSPQQTREEESLDGDDLSGEQSNGGDGEGGGAGRQDQAPRCGETHADGYMIFIFRYSCTEASWYLTGSRNGAGTGAAEAGRRRAARARTTKPWRGKQG